MERIAAAGQRTPEFARPIVTPFVVPTVLAAPHCLLRHRDGWAEATTAAVRLGGDVDTLGAIVGALAGIRQGVGGIPKALLDAVRDAASLHRLARRYWPIVADA